MHECRGWLCSDEAGRASEQSLEQQQQVDRLRASSMNCAQPQTSGLNCDCTVTATAHLHRHDGAVPAPLVHTPVGCGEWEACSTSHHLVEAAGSNGKLCSGAHPSG